MDKMIYLQNKALACALLLISLLCFAGFAQAEPSVDGDTISWPSDGWYQVQSTDGRITYCNGGSSCRVEPGTYLVINHNSGVRYSNVVVSGRPDDPGVIQVQGLIITTPGDGWYQVQNAQNWSSLCEGAGPLECTVPAAGTYNVINLTQGVRYEGIKVSGGSEEGEITVNGSRIHWNSDDWFQVQSADGATTWCEGRDPCGVPNGTYLVINLTTGERHPGIVVSDNVEGADTDALVRDLVAEFDDYLQLTPLSLLRNFTVELLLQAYDGELVHTLYDEHSQPDFLDEYFPELESVDVIRHGYACPDGGHVYLTQDPYSINAGAFFTNCQSNRVTLTARFGLRTNWYNQNYYQSWSHIDYRDDLGQFNVRSVRLSMSGRTFISRGIRISTTPIDSSRTGVFSTGAVPDLSIADWIILGRQLATPDEWTGSLSVERGNYRSTVLNGETVRVTSSGSRLEDYDGQEFRTGRVEYLSTDIRMLMDYGQSDGTGGRLVTFDRAGTVTTHWVPDTESYDVLDESTPAYFNDVLIGCSFNSLRNPSPCD